MKKYLTLSSFIILLCIFTVTLSAFAASFNIIEVEGKYAIVSSEPNNNSNNFFRNKSNVLRALAIANPYTTYVAKTANAPGGIIIYGAETDRSKIQKQLDEMSSKFFQADSEAKNSYFATAISLKDYSKIMHQAKGKYVLFDAKGNKVEKNIAPLNMANASNPQPPKEQPKKIEYPAITNASVVNSYINSYSVEILNADAHKKMQAENKFWRNDLGTKLEADLNKRIFQAVKSPDGSKIAFIAANTTENPAKWPSAIWNLYIVNVDGTELTKITNNDTMIGKTIFYWSANSKYLVYHQMDKKDDYNLYRYGLTSKKSEQISNGADCAISKMTDNGKYIAYLVSNGEVGDYNLWLTNLENDNSQLLAKNTTADFLTWSPNNSKLLYSKLAGDKSEYRALKIEVLDLATSNSTNVGEYREYAQDRAKDKDKYAIAWSKDNQHLVYATAKSRQQRELYSYDLKDSKSTMITTKKSVGNIEPENNGIYFIEESLDNNNYSLWSYNYDATGSMECAQGVSEEIACAVDKNKAVFSSNNNLWFLCLSNKYLVKLFTVNDFAVGNFSKFRMSDVKWSEQGTKLYCTLKNYGGNKASVSSPILTVGLTLVLGMK